MNRRSFLKTSVGAGIGLAFAETPGVTGMTLKQVTCSIN
jgi:hypothetical protein